jgi:hypothetical protein
MAANELLFDHQPAEPFERIGRSGAISELTGVKISLR